MIDDSKVACGSPECQATGTIDNENDALAMNKYLGFDWKVGDKPVHPGKMHPISAAATVAHGEVRRPCQGCGCANFVPIAS